VLRGYAAVGGVVVVTACQRGLLVMPWGTREVEKRISG